jgi:glycerophosphoryl diester phosphodiesterase
MKVIITIAAFLLFSGLLSAQQNILKQGHRGCRGNMPENTIPAMKKALDMGVQVLELDVVISKDKQVVVSHDVYMSSDIILKPSGDTITPMEAKDLILYTMNYADIKKYDAGSKHNRQFPEQQHFKTYKPLLSELIDSVERYAREHKLPMPMYNIEIKSQPKTDKVAHPEPQEFVDLVINVCKSRDILKRMNIQSFDVRPLQLLHQQYPTTVKLSFLTANAKTLEENLQDLGFTPDFYSPYYKTVTENVVKGCHEKQVKIIPWTVNTKQEIDALLAWDVDGIITDYPELL